MSFSRSDLACVCGAVTMQEDSVLKGYSHSSVFQILRFNIINMEKRCKRRSYRTASQVKVGDGDWIPRSLVAVVGQSMKLEDGDFTRFF